MLHGPMTTDAMIDLHAQCIHDALEDVRAERAFLEQHPMITADDLRVYGEHPSPRIENALQDWTRDLCRNARQIHGGV